LKKNNNLYLITTHSLFLTAALMLVARGEKAAQTLAFGIFAAGFALLLRYPEALVAAVNAVPFLGAFSYGGVTALIALLVLMALVICWRLARRPTHLFNLAIMLTLLFFAYLVLNWYLSGQVDEEGGAGKLRLYFIRGVIPVALVLTLDDTLNRLRGFLFSWVSFALLSSLMIVATYLGLASLSGADWGGSGRIGLFGFDPISFSLPIGIAGIILVHYFLHATHAMLKPVILALFGFMFFSLFPTGSRQTLLAMAVGILVYTFIAYRSFFGKALAAMVVLLALLAAFFGVAGRYKSDRFDVMAEGYAKNSSFQGRMITLERGMETFRGAPLFGVGLGGHGKYIYTTNPHTGKRVKDKEHVHNLFVELLAEQGIVGLTLFLLPLAMVCWQLSRRLREGQTDQHFRTHAGLLFALLAFALLQANISGGISVSGAFMTTLVAWASMLSRKPNDQTPLLREQQPA